MLPGDVNADGQVNVMDIDLLSAEIIAGGSAAQFDLNGDSTVDFADQAVLVHDILNIWFGDANLDGEFNSGDFVATFTQGKYESGVDATWGEGDWNADGKFDSSDFVSAFSDGGYENGPRPAVAAVPEPTCATLLVLGAALMAINRRRR